MSKLKFGTSGIRGLASDFTVDECFRFVNSFFATAAKDHRKQCLVAGDLRSSTPQIKEYLFRSLQAIGVEGLDAGEVPTPVLAWGCYRRGLPGIMVTGSHIPADRNGIKFYCPSGEILKEDEERILSYYNDNPISFGVQYKKLSVTPKVDLAADFAERYFSAFNKDVLAGIRVGFYSHSSVSRDYFPQILQALGAEVMEFGRSSEFVAVDTEAVESISALSEVMKSNNLNVIVSTDGDADRPLIVLDNGQQIPGEILGLITAKHLKLDAIVYPISCSSTLSNSKTPHNKMVTKIGSPFVLAGMLNQLSEQKSSAIGGFEANGGFLLGSAVMGLQPLMTRDSLLPMLSFLAAFSESRMSSTAEYAKPYLQRSNLSGLIKNIDSSKAERVLSLFKLAINDDFGHELKLDLGVLKSVNKLDGFRAIFETGDIIHLRPSGNAPEFRIYIESASPEKASVILEKVKDWVVSVNA